MTREEEILQAAAYTLKVFRSSFVKSIERIWVTAFTTGAYWADRHPQNVWHDASEHPTEVGAILYRTTLGSFELVVHGTSSEDMWKVFVKDYGVVQWAYVNDLLPKTK